MYTRNSYEQYDAEIMLSQIYAILVVIYQIVRAFKGLSQGTYLDPVLDTVVITGGSSGLGRILCRNLAHKGVRVAILDIVEPAERSGGGIQNFYECDIGDSDQVEETMQRVLEDLGPVSVLINNAGMSKRASIVDTPVEDIKKMIDVNLLSHFYTTKAALPGMIRRGRGYIVTIASALGFQSAIEYAPYCASKAGLIALHESLTAEVPEYGGIKTLLVVPGQMRTQMFSDIIPPHQFFAPLVEPEDLAAQIILAIERGHSGHISEPLYVNFMPIIRALPEWTVWIFRYLSGMDKAVRMADAAVAG
ncbi:uncharacterized protein V1518DRAFT_413581 [Limtongia smithiae]|uniref:uncharacterized protein n=1 Tax=Limtongia smithiae TaxID=1125753 RepID=UPI0034CE2D8E